METVSYDEFKKMDVRLGEIREATPVNGTDKLLHCKIDFGETNEAGETVLREIVSGIRESHPDHDGLVGKQVLYIINLEPREICGVTSSGMLMAVDGIDGEPVFLVGEKRVVNGSKVR